MRRCARPGCGHLVPAHRRWCTRACAELTRRARRVQHVREVVGPGAAMRLLHAVRAETPPGVCPHCDGPLPQTRSRPRVRCDSPECRRLYHRDYEAARRQVEV